LEGAEAAEAGAADGEAAARSTDPNETGEADAYVAGVIAVAALL
jgi:hypothetical protein